MRHHSRFCVWQVNTKPAQLSGAERRRIMPSYSPELIQTMRAALNEVMTRIPTDQATQAIQAYMAEYILKVAAEGQTNYKDLLDAASGQIQIAMSRLNLMRRIVSSSDTWRRDRRRLRRGCGLAVEDEMTIHFALIYVLRNEERVSV